MVSRSFQLLTFSKIFLLRVHFQVGENYVKENQFVDARDEKSYENILVYLPGILLGLCSLILHLKNEFGFKIQRCCFVILDISFV